MRRFPGGLVLVALCVLATTGRGHFHMLLPDRPSVKKGEKVLLAAGFGHPFEQQLFDMNAPARLIMLPPEGPAVDLTRKMKKVELPGEKGKVTGYHLEFTPTQRGDHVFVLTTAPTYLEDDREYVQDTVKLVLHVQAQKGWERSASRDLEWLPLTRPYGLLPGMVFQAQIDQVVGLLTAPLAGALVEIERYNPVPPKKMPADEFITRTARTDRNGTVVTTLTEPGWWGLTATRPLKTRMSIAGKGALMEVKQRSTLWVHVARDTTGK